MCNRPSPACQINSSPRLSHISIAKTHVQFKNLKFSSKKCHFLIKISNFSKKSISEQNDSFHANRPDFQVWNCYHNDFSRTSKIMLIWDHFVGLTRAGNLFKPIWSFWLFKYSVFRQKNPEKRTCSRDLDEIFECSVFVKSVIFEKFRIKELENNLFNHFDQF